MANKQARDSRDKPAHRHGAESGGRRVGCASPGLTGDEVPPRPPLPLPQQSVFPRRRPRQGLSRCLTSPGTGDLPAVFSVSRRSSPRNAGRVLPGAVGPAAAPESRGHEPCHPGKATAPPVPLTAGGLAVPGFPPTWTLPPVRGGQQHRRHARGRGGRESAGSRVGWCQGALGHRSRTVTFVHGSHRPGPARPRGRSAAPARLRLRLRHRPSPRPGGREGGAGKALRSSALGHGAAGSAQKPRQVTAPGTGTEGQAAAGRARGGMAGRWGHHRRLCRGYAQPGTGVWLYTGMCTCLGKPGV